MENDFLKIVSSDSIDKAKKGLDLLKIHGGIDITLEDLNGSNATILATQKPSYTGNIIDDNEFAKVVNNLVDEVVKSDINVTVNLSTEV